MLHDWSANPTKPSCRGRSRHPYRHFPAPQPQSFYNESFQKEIEAFEEQIKIAKTKNETKFPKVAEPKQTHINEQTISYFHFDPNTLDSIGFISLGLKPWIISNILKYRSKGGVFKTDSDFGKIYGFDKKLFSTLQPFIQIAKTKEVIKTNNLNDFFLKKK